jgi:hypothetical protein
VVQGDVPNKATAGRHGEVPDYKLFLDTVRLPNQPHDPGVMIGGHISAGERRSDDNHAIVKADVLLFGSSTLTGTYTRGRPNRTTPRVLLAGTKPEMPSKIRSIVDLAQSELIARFPELKKLDFAQSQDKLPRLLGGWRSS